MTLRGSTFTESHSILWRRGSVGVDEGWVELSFDDGPEPRSDVSPRLLDVLQKHDVRAFFCHIGCCVLSNPDIARRVVDEGHQIVNHTHSHDFRCLGDLESLRNEINRADSVIEEATGFMPRAFRPPGGVMGATARRLCRDDGRPVVPISAYMFDANAFSPERLLRNYLNVIKRDRGGSIVVHEQRFTLGPEPRPRSWIPLFVDSLLEEVHQMGFRFTEPCSLRPR